MSWVKDEKVLRIVEIALQNNLPVTSDFILEGVPFFRYYLHLQLSFRPKGEILKIPRFARKDSRRGDFILPCDRRSWMFHLDCSFVALCKIFWRYKPV